MHYQTGMLPSPSCQFLHVMHNTLAAQSIYGGIDAVVCAGPRHQRGPQSFCELAY